MTAVWRVTTVLMEEIVIHGKMAVIVLMDGLALFATRVRTGSKHTNTPDTHIYPIMVTFADIILTYYHFLETYPHPTITTTCITLNVTLTTDPRISFFPVGGMAFVLIWISCPQSIGAEYEIHPQKWPMTDHMHTHTDTHYQIVASLKSLAVIDSVIFQFHSLSRGIFWSKLFLPL